MSDPTLDLNKITRTHVKIRDARAELKKAFDTRDSELKAQQQLLEGAMLDHLNKSGSESVRTESGTFYAQEEIQPSCQDWSALYAWVAEHDAWDVLERRIKKTFVKEYQEVHGGALPPGVSVMREKIVRVRRA